ncbi:MAG: glutamate-5-semialdehyde dehydrogenase [Victivallales bacterium]|nr:glutamate-5-semialdehyde dehydrogenase [Victivallales bacterium]
MSGKTTPEMIAAAMDEMGEKAKMASRSLAAMSSSDKNGCLLKIAKAIESESAVIQAENGKDLNAGVEKGLSKAMLDRLELTDARIAGMAKGLREVAALEDPVGRKLSNLIRPNGLEIEKVSVPIGVIGIIFESRPNVTIDAAGLCLKAGNAVILRGGSEAINSNKALTHCANLAGMVAGLPEGAIQLVPWTDRAAVSKLLKMDNYVDLIIPRGGEGLIRAVVEQSTIPVIKHYKGVCHIYVDSECDVDMARKIVINAKCQRPGVCNAIETLLVNGDIAAEFAPVIADELKSEGVELRGGREFRGLVPDAVPAVEEDWSEEYLDLILSVKIVPDVEAAVKHINRYGSGHSDGIITTNKTHADFFLRDVDSATVYLNASTRFTDGGEFGMGAEIGISTDKLHARGPMALPELTTYKYLVLGAGQIRS